MGDVTVAEAKRDALAELTQHVWMQTIDYWMGLLQFLYGRFQELNLLRAGRPTVPARGQCGQRRRRPGARGRVHGAAKPPPRAEHGKLNVPGDRDRLARAMTPTEQHLITENDDANRPRPRSGSGARMNSIATETTVTRRPSSRANRSPVLSHFRTNPFRVLRVPPDVGVDEAIWRSEEALARSRAGLGLPDGEMIPWLVDPDEPEIRQAVQRIEEPLRRLTDQVFWFDPDHDSDGEPSAAS